MKIKLMFASFLALFLPFCFFFGERAFAAIDWPDAPDGYSSWGSIGDLLFPDLGNQRLGIGTGSPQGRFHVVGGGKRVTMTADSVDGNGTNNCNTGQEKVFVSTTGIAIGDTLEGDSILSVGSNYICTNKSSVSWKSGEEKWWKKTGTDVLIADTGRVGIGTTSPNAQLHVKTNAGTNSEVDIQTANLTHWGIYQDEATADLRFWNTNNRLTITDDGKVGIGTTSPTTVLDVNGQVKGTQFCIGSDCRSSWSGGGATWGSIIGTLSNQSDLNTALNAKLNLSGGTMTGLLTLSGNPISNLGAATKQYVDSAVSGFSSSSIHDADNNTKVQTEESTNENKIRFDTNGTERMIIDSSGNVGIGTNAPGGKLHIYNSSGNGAELILDTIPGATASAVRFYMNGSYVGNVAYNPTAGGVLEGMSIGGGNGQANSLYIQRNTENIGIGTLSPQGRLHIYNKLTTGAELVLDTVGGSKASAIQFFLGGVHKGTLSYSPGFNTMSLGSPSVPNILNIKMDGETNSGYVGIGTTSPSQKLDVVGNIAVNGATVHTSDIRLKKDIVTLSDSLSKILSLRGVSFFWKDPERGEEKQIGVIAQEVEKEFPELVLEDNEGMKSVNYSALVAPLIEAVKEQQQEIINLKQEKNEQEEKIEALFKKINRLEAIIEEQQ